MGRHASALGNQKWSLAVIGHGTEGRDAGSCELSRARVPICASTRSSCSLSIVQRIVEAYEAHEVAQDEERQARDDKRRSRQSRAARDGD